MSQQSTAESEVRASGIEKPSGTSLCLIPAALLSASGFVLFAREDRIFGFVLLVAMGTAMILAVGIPYAVSRFITKDHAVRFPVRTGQPWSHGEKLYLPVVLVLGYSLIPLYMIRTGVYASWPALNDPEGVARLFLGTNVPGIWDEVFFICTAFTLLRRHLPDWQAPTCCRLCCSRRSCGNWDSRPGRRSLSSPLHCSRRGSSP